MQSLGCFSIAELAIQPRWQLSLAFICAWHAFRHSASILCLSSDPDPCLDAHLSSWTGEYNIAFE